MSTIFSLYVLACKLRLLVHISVSRNVMFVFKFIGFIFSAESIYKFHNLQTSSFLLLVHIKLYHQLFIDRSRRFLWWIVIKLLFKMIHDNSGIRWYKDGSLSTTSLFIWLSYFIYKHLLIYIHTYRHLIMNIYIYIYICVCIYKYEYR